SQSEHSAGRLAAIAPAPAALPPSASAALRITHVADPAPWGPPSHTHWARLELGTGHSVRPAEGRNLSLAEDAGGESIGAFRVRRIERDDCQYGQREIASGSERRDRTKELELRLIETKLVGEHDVAELGLVAGVVLGDSRISHEFLVERFELGI